MTEPKKIQELQELAKAILSLEPEVQQQITPAFERLVVTLEEKYKALELVMEALGQIRLDVKYLVFDLESTRQERDELKARWENR